MNYCHVCGNQVCSDCDGCNNPTCDNCSCPNVAESRKDFLLETQDHSDGFEKSLRGLPLTGASDSVEASITEDKKLELIVPELPPQHQRKVDEFMKYAVRAINDWITSGQYDHFREHRPILVIPSQSDNMPKDAETVVVQLLGGMGYNARFVDHAIGSRPMTAVMIERKE